VTLLRHHLGMSAPEDHPDPQRVEFVAAMTSLGSFIAAASERGLCWLALGDDANALLGGLLRRFPGARRVVIPDLCGDADQGDVDRGAADHGVVVSHITRDKAPDNASDQDRRARLLAQALEAVERPAESAGLPLDLRGTLFQLAVWAQLQRIAPGTAISYAELARRVGRPSAFRAVAQACGANPVGVLVPCHRVIASDGGLGGFGFGLARKRELLRREGVDLQNRRTRPTGSTPP